MARIIGKDALPVRQQLTLLCAGPRQRRVPAPVGVLATIDRVCAPGAAERDDAAARALHRSRGAARSRAACTPSGIAQMACVRPLQRMGEDIARRRARRASPTLQAAMEREFAALTARAGGAAMRLTAEGAATRLEGPLLFLRRTLDVGLHDAVEVRGARRPRAARPRGGDRPRLDDDRGAGIDGGPLARRHRRALLRRAAVVRAVARHPRPRVQRRRAR